MKAFIFNLLNRRLMLISILIIGVASALGLLLDAKGFIVNVTAGIVGIFIGFALGLLILDKYIDTKREQQWTRVRNLTYKSIANHLCDVIQEMGIWFWDLDFPTKEYLMNPISEGRDHPHPATIIAMTKMASELRDLPSALSTDNTFSDTTVKFYEEDQVQWDLDQIRDVLTPRVIQSSADQNIIDALMQFDNARLKLHNAVYVHKRLVIGGIFHNVIELLEQAQKVYSSLCENWQ